jgi:UDP-N-acetylmuramyl pentapeptide phosphotransferase/UDP-N-acetylglucosamine-1-phosphate transferase
VNVPIPFLTKRAIVPIVLACLLVAAVAGAQHYLLGRLYYPNVVIKTQDNMSLEFLNEGVTRVEDCEAATDMIANTIRASCPMCSVTQQQCPAELESRQRRLLSDEPIETPSSRLPKGVVAYISDNRELALAACREAERLAGTGQGFRATCFPPNSRRPLYAAPLPHSPSALQNTGLGALVLILTALASAFTGFLILRYESLHEHWSADPVDAGPQKFHATPTPRIGGLGVMAGLLISKATLRAFEQGSASELFGYLLFASLPAFLGGITEDATKNVSVAARLALTMLAAAVGVWLLGAVIPRLDIPGIDTLLGWAPFAITFTVFAVGGVANAINIIDGYNGLAAGHSVIVLAALAWVSAAVGDTFLLFSALAMAGALLGFLVWNYPGGKIFLGDGGAYLLGFWLGEIGVLLVVRHPEVSPWFPMLLLVYPIFETLFSIYRRKVMRGLSPGQPDRQHLHQVIYGYLTRRSPPASEDLTRSNSRVAPFSWLMTLACAIPAVALWRQTQWLVTASLVFCAVYLCIYGWLSRASRDRA